MDTLTSAATNKTFDGPAPNGGFKMAFQQMDQILSKLSETPGLPQNDALIVSTSLEFARICFVLGKGFNRLNRYLHQALEAAQRLGDHRSEAMVKLHLGRLFYFSEQREKAIKIFTDGKSLVESLGDADITSQASELIGLFYFIQGHFREAQVFFEQATQNFEFGEYSHSGPMWLSYCHAFLGHYNRAIGTIDYYRRIALERGNTPFAITLRTVLGIFLLRVRKLKDAAFHLSGALQDAIRGKNNVAEYFARGALAFYHQTEGRVEESKKMLETAVAFGWELGLVKQYASPFVLEMIYEYHRCGLAPVKGLSFEEESMRILQGPNIHLCAVALRLMAMDGLAKGTDSGHIRSMLQQSEKLLKRSGDPVQLAKTRVEMARLSLKQHNQDQARRFAQKAWKGFSGYGDIFYPDDLQFLLVHKDETVSGHGYREPVLERFTELIEELISGYNVSELLTRTLKATNRFLSAERGGIFFFRQPQKKKAPELIAAHNLFKADISEDLFRPSLELIFKALHENRPMIRHNRTNEIITGRVRAMIAIPFEVDTKEKYILYHDNAYINDCFSHYTEEEISGLAGSLSKYINYMSNLNRLYEEKASSHYRRLGDDAEFDIVAQSPAMKKLLKQADRVADTGSTVLLTGQTGAGKEVMARRIHRLSSRNNQPLVIVDPTTIPETLFESELFGHEKGAFTGAEKQKTGRIELAHKGTLFIDEVGEIPTSVQAKLLRALQEKTIVRVGGIKTIKTDFRLIAATNRDLKTEVKKGRFREDLFYRLDVIPLHLPPLKKRGDDILLLAHLFLEKYSTKYNRSGLVLTQSQKNTLLKYEWPGNIRELKNIIERAVLLAEDDLPAIDLKPDPAGFRPEQLFSSRPSLDEMQRRYIEFTLEESNGKIGGPGGAAEKLGMKRTSLYARMRTLSMR